jgi:Na+-translocating ferredoxin:NAD+ oxidoreductase subunit D
MAERLSVGVSPHIHGGESVPKAIWAVFLALLPSGVAGVIIFGLAALKVIIISIASCLITEFLIQKLRHKKITLYDGSAALTGLLLAYNLSSGAPFWIPLAGGIFAIAIAKHTFGGLGANIFNPALAARAFLLASWPRQMTNFYRPLSLDAVSSATPLAMLKEGGTRSLSGLGLSYGDLFLGNRPGCLGEVCALALILGAAYLLWKRYIWYHAPMGFILSLGALSWMFGQEGFLKGDFLFAILSGGFILGAFFMATDYVTTPITKKGQLAFGIGCGVITFVIRKFGGYPEGVSYSILMMNAATPLIDRWVRPRRYGVK